MVSGPDFLHAPDGLVVHTGQSSEKKKPGVEDSRPGAIYMLYGLVVNTGRSGQKEDSTTAPEHLNAPDGPVFPPDVLDRGLCNMKTTGINTHRTVQWLHQTVRWSATVKFQSQRSTQPKSNLHAPDCPVVTKKSCSFLPTASFEAWPIYTPLAGLHIVVGDS